MSKADTNTAKETDTLAFQGEHGAYSELAAKAFDVTQRSAGSVPLQTVPCSSFDAVFATVNDGRATRGIVPIENSLAGTIHRNMDLLLRYDLNIIAEAKLHVQHCLMALPGTALDELNAVYSHPQALAQCEHTLRNLGLTPIAHTDTAGSAKHIATNRIGDHGALASELAASTYGLNILRHDMQDVATNTTRFLVITKSSDTAPIDNNQNNKLKTSIAFSLDNVSGALFKALAVFALRDIELTKIESRPATPVISTQKTSAPSATLPENEQRHTWDYLFYLDFVTNSHENALRSLDHLREIAPFVRILGTYPATA